MKCGKVAYFEDEPPAERELGKDSGAARYEAGSA